MTSTDAFQGGFLSPPLFVNDHFTKKKENVNIPSIQKENVSKLLLFLFVLFNQRYIDLVSKAKYNHVKKLISLLIS